MLKYNPKMSFLPIIPECGQLGGAERFPLAWSEAEAGEVERRRASAERT